MGMLFGKPGMPSQPKNMYPAPAPIATPAPEDPAVKAAALVAAENQRRAALNAKGQQSTILSGGMGDTTKAPVKMRTLLGEA